MTQLEVGGCEFKVSDKPLTGEPAHIERTLRGQPDGTPEKKEVLTLTRFIDEVWWPTYPTYPITKHCELSR